MKTSKLKKIICLLACITILSISFTSSAVKADLECPNPLANVRTMVSESGWTYNWDDHCHAGTSTLYFNIRDIDYSALINYVNVAWSTIWNNYENNHVIEFLDADDPDNIPPASTVYISRIQTLDGNTNIIAYSDANHQGYHTSEWSITVVKDKWLEVQETIVRSRIMAHEIGHIYGLGHTDSTHNNAIMKASGMTTSDWVRDYERKAMELLTHQHTCSSFTYANLSSAQHRKICSYCKAYTLQSHTMPSNWSNYSETKHRKYCNKNCGYYEEANHNYTSAAWFQYSSTHHGRYCTASGCNRIDTAPHTWEYHGTVAVCTVCGYTKDLRSGLPVDYKAE